MSKEVSEEKTREKLGLAARIKHLCSSWRKLANNLFKDRSGKSEMVSNNRLLKKQKLLVSAAVLLIIFIISSLYILQGKQGTSQLASAKQSNGQRTGQGMASKEQVASVAKLELADAGLDTERRWRDHLESIIEQQQQLVEQRLQKMEVKSEQMTKAAEELIAQDTEVTRQKMEQAREQMLEAEAGLKRVVAQEELRQRQSVSLEQAEIKRQRFNEEVEFDQPKSVRNYMPEGTYFTGHLLGGIAVSTALNTADENATPVIIRLQERGNLHAANKLRIDKCRIMGSAYGDLSSERAVIRLEKLICEVNGFYHTSKIAGQIFGPDGLNGIKGRVVDTSNKHVKNIILSGMVSGLANSVKGGEGAVLSSSGVAVTQQKNMGDYFKQGAVAGVGNVGDKIANYFLKQAESMSPVLTIDAGVKVNVQIIRGFYFGEIGTHRQIKKLRQ